MGVQAVVDQAHHDPATSGKIAERGNQTVASDTDCSHCPLCTSLCLACQPAMDRACSAPWVAATIANLPHNPLEGLLRPPRPSV
jgi:hypothetical protein